MVERATNDDEKHTHRNGSNPLTAPNCARATPDVFAARDVVTLAATATRDVAAIVIIVPVVLDARTCVRPTSTGAGASGAREGTRG